jgi:hypothetical protein
MAHTEPLRPRLRNCGDRAAPWESVLRSGSLDSPEHQVNKGGRVFVTIVLVRGRRQLALQVKVEIFNSPPVCGGAS